MDHIAQAEAILDDLAMPVTADSHVGAVTLKPSATAGIATGTASDDWTHLMRAADIALYQAKHANTRYCCDVSDNPAAAPPPTGRGRRHRRSASCESEALARSPSQTSLATRKRESGGYRLGGEAGSGTEFAVFPRWDHRPQATDTDPSHRKGILPAGGMQPGPPGDLRSRAVPSGTGALPAERE